MSYNVELFVRMRSRELVLPRNVPIENFPSAWSVSSEKKYSCSALQVCSYGVVLLLLLGIIGVVVFLGLRGHGLGGYVADNEKGEIFLLLRNSLI